MAGGMKPERQFRRMLEQVRDHHASYPESEWVEAYYEQPTTQVAWASAATFTPEGTHYARNAGALVKCLYCGRTNSLTDALSCPGCGAPIQIEGEHR